MATLLAAFALLAAAHGPPNWQNHRFPDASSFVVELPRGALAPGLKSRLSGALARMGRWVRED